MEKSFPLDELIDIDELQSIQDSFARATGISSVIFSPEGEPLTRLTNPTEFYSLIQSTEKGRKRCLRSFMEMGKKALESEKSDIFYCFAHCGHFVTPIMINGEHKGTMFAGQFIPEKFSPEQLQNLEKIALEIDLDPGLLVKEAEKMRVVEENVIRNYSSLLFLIVGVIARREAQAAELIMAKDALQEAHNGLEKRVQERTSELAEANKELKHEITERKLAEDAIRESEEKYRNIIENIQDIFYRGDMKGNLIMISASGAKQMGYDSVEAMMGLNIAKTFYAVPEERDGFLKVLGKTGVVNDYEITLKRKDGTLIPVRASSHIYFDKSGNPLGVEGLLSDLTERKRADQEIENLQRYTRLLIESNLDALVTFDHKGIIMDMNGAMIQATGRTREELIGTPFAYHFTDPERAYKGAMLAFEIGGVRDYELVMKARDGTETIVSYNTSIYRDQTGDVVGAFAAARDITERRAAEEEIKKKTEELEGFNKLAVGRELKMIELKKEINTLLGKLGEEPGYKIVGDA